MKIIKVVLDRPKLTSEEIAKKQDFEKVLHQSKQSQITTTKLNYWFYGAIGLSSIALLVFFNWKSNTSHNEVLQSDNLRTKKDLFIESEPSKVNPSVFANQSVSDESNSKDKLRKKYVKQAAVVKQIQPETDSFDANENLESGEKHVSMEAMESSNNNQRLFFPLVAGKFEGEIKISDLVKDAHLYLEDGAEVSSFEIFYLKGRKEIVQFVEGNEIPSNICNDLSMNLYQTVFISKISAKNKSNKPIKGESMMFKIIQ